MQEFRESLRIISQVSMIQETHKSQIKLECLPLVPEQDPNWTRQGWRSQIGPTSSRINEGEHGVSHSPLQGKLLSAPSTTFCFFFDSSIDIFRRILCASRRNICRYRGSKRRNGRLPGFVSRAKLFCGNGQPSFSVTVPIGRIGVVSVPQGLPTWRGPISCQDVSIFNSHELL